MTLTSAPKPAYEEWMYWSQVVIDRLTTIVHVYSRPPHEDVFMPEAERQHKVADSASVLRHLHEISDSNELSVLKKSVAQTTEHDIIKDRIVAALQPVFREVLRRLPAWSSDMQFLLKSPWYDKCAGMLAQELFCGPHGRENEGIGSGLPEHGRLPETLQNLMEQEEIGDSRAPFEEHPYAYQKLRREGLARLWSLRNSAFLRSAGRVD